MRQLMSSGDPRRRALLKVRGSVRSGADSRTAREVPDGYLAPVLIACGDRHERDCLGRVLDRCGYRALLFADGPHLLTVADEQRPAAVVVDWLTPGCTGPEICTRLKTRPALRRVPVLLIAARGDHAQVAEGFRAGADDVVTRPLDLAELVRLVARRAARAGGRRDRT